ncbi:MAG TPA: hypothetical protein VFX03_06140, partial [Thermomicrobiales bacterium]|nr:hypothetical protein [Thermomicrobiales bacterium]
MTDPGAAVRIRIRPAAADDLVAAAHVYQLADGAPEAEAAAALDDLRIFHEDDPAQVWVAEADGAVVGMGA